MVHASATTLGVWLSYLRRDDIKSINERSIGKELPGTPSAGTCNFAVIAGTWRYFTLLHGALIES